MSCPECRAELSFREYAWTHTHEPPLALKLIGAGMMAVGLALALSGISALFAGA